MDTTRILEIRNGAAGTAVVVARWCDSCIDWHVYIVPLEEAVSDWLDIELASLPTTDLERLEETPDLGDVCLICDRPIFGHLAGSGICKACDEILWQKVSEW